jgi:hypothetical protein
MMSLMQVLAIRQLRLGRSPVVKVKVEEDS